MNRFGYLDGKTHQPTGTAPDPRIERLRAATEAEDLEFRRSDAPAFIVVVTRSHGNPYYPTKTPDLNSLRYSGYIDATGTHRLRGPEDIARYAAFVTGADPMEFGPHKILKPEQRRVPVRYADDVIVGFEHERDARRFWNELRERLQKFALSLHPEKTRLIEFGRLAVQNRRARGLGKPKTFDFLGFTFICGKSRKGKFLIKRKTRRDRMRTKLRTIKEEMRRRMHQSIPQQGKWLRQVVIGYFNYHAVPTNFRALVVFRDEVTRAWRRRLSRRSQKGALTWARMLELAADWLPKPHICHPWPNQRFAVTHPRWEPYAGKPHVRFCAGGAQQ